jgi:hypothetical protein
MNENLKEEIKGKYSVKKHVKVSPESRVLSEYSVKFDDNEIEVKLA